MEASATDEQAVTESCGEAFSPYYEETMQFLMKYLIQEMPKEYKQFKGQLIETITMISISVSKELRTKYQSDLIKGLLFIQNNQIDQSYDPQLSYLLAGWQRLALVMQEDFAPFLPEIIPPLLNISSLKPKVGVKGDTGDILQFLSEVTVSKDGKTLGVKSDEIEDKNVAIQMLTVIIDEMKGHFAPYIHQTSELFFSMINYEASEDIRNSVANSLPVMIECLVESYPQDKELHLKYGVAYMQALFKAMESEKSIDTMVYQVLATKDIIKHLGNFMDAETVNQMCEKFLGLITSSDRRKELNTQYTNENESGETEIDKQNREFMEEEMKVEDELQIAISETFGVLFKTHKDQCKLLVETLFGQLLPDYLSEGKPDIKKKFALFVIVDLIEHLGLDRIDEAQFKGCFEILVIHAQHPNPVLR